MGIVMPGTQLNYSYSYWENRIRDKNYKVKVKDAPDLYFPNSARVSKTAKAGFAVLDYVLNIIENSNSCFVRIHLQLSSSG